MLSKNSVFYLLLLLIAGFGGYYLGKDNNRQAGPTTQIIEKIVYIQPDTNHKNDKPKTRVTKTIEQKNIDKAYQKIQASNPYLPQYPPNQETFNQIIDNLSLPELEDYFNKLVAKDDMGFNQIYDKHTFVKSLVREFLAKQDNSHLNTSSSISFSLSGKPNLENPVNFKVSNNQKTLYAHLQLDKQQTMMGNTFIKWVHTDSGKVLLFKQKDINPITRQNWVNFTPDKNWQIGHYQITFYQLNSQLTPIVQGGYYVE